MPSIANPSNSRQYRESTKKQVLESIEKGAKQAAVFIKRKKKLREAKELLREL